MQGIIVKGIGGFYYIKAEDSKIYECKARGIFRKEKIKPMIGDRVEIETDGDKGNIVNINNRINELVRPPVANIDTLVIVTAAKDPTPDLFFIDKLILTAEIRNIEPVICINKTDLGSAKELKRIYQYTGYKIFDICASQGKGISELYKFLVGKTTAFAGLSGVGKSTTLSLFVDDDIETGDLSNKINRGKHTTRHVELFELKDGGFVLDTPGFSSFEHDIIRPQELSSYFPEMREYINECRFKGCSHINEPGCSVKDAVLQGIISKERYESYCRMYDTLKQVKEWEM